MRERSQCCRWSADFEAGLTDVNVAQSTDTIILVHVHQHCKAKFFLNERLSHSSMHKTKFGLCCGDGKVKLWTVPEPPESLATLLTDRSSQCYRR